MAAKEKGKSPERNKGTRKRATETRKLWYGLLVRGR